MIIDFGDHVALKELGEGQFGSRVDYLNLSAKDRRGLGAVIVRPDGFAAWAIEDDEKPDIDAAKAALEKWFAF